MLKTAIENDCIILYPEADLVESKTKEFVEKVRVDIEKGGKFKSLILDMANVKIIDSVGISFIVGLYKTVTGYGKGFKVKGVNNDIGQLFKLMKFDSVFEFECINV